MSAALLILPAAPRPAHPQLRRLLACVAVVLALHLLILQGMPGLPTLRHPAPQTVQVSGRMLQVQSDPAPTRARPAAPTAAPTAAVEPARRAAAPAARPPAPPQPKPQQDLAHTASAASLPPDAAAHTPAETPTASTPVAPPQARPPAEPSEPAGLPAAKAGSRQPTRFAPPTRLVYEGRGQERGFINYAGSAELNWLPQGANYQARLEITAFGLRLVSWTSKGALEEGQGLLPLRFGDRRRGPETATHFQRDKGIISFSANNPDVPLQPGAQDKLSMLLQLGALAAAAPEAFAPGRRVQFQAADAHGAQTLEFVAGPLQDMELPGGTLRVLPLTREPSAEFDQKIEVWLGPDVSYLPVRLRITESNGTYSDLLWKRTQTPEPG